MFWEMVMVDETEKKLPKCSLSKGESSGKTEMSA